jgi:hypothetical protein
MKRRLAAVAAFAAAAVVLALPAPAQAGPQQERYVAVSSSASSLIGWFWIDRIDGIIGCNQCIWRIDVKTSHELSADNEKLFQASLMNGLGKLSSAKVADPRTAAVLKAQALTEFQAGARALGTAQAGVGVVGYYNVDTRQTTVVERAWLSAADQDLADGFTALQRAASDPSPNPWIIAAQREFDEAYAEIAGKVAI